MLTRLIVTLIIYSFPLLAQGTIQLENRNYNIFFIDFLYPSEGRALTLERTYNSKSTFTGMFGFGWGSNYETKLTELSDGTVLIAEYGGGFEALYTPKGFSTDNIEKFVNQILKHPQLEPTLRTQDFKKKLLVNQKYREEKAKSLGIKEMIPENTLLTTTERGLETIEKKRQNGAFVWIRKTYDGRTQTFNAQGSLIKEEVNPRIYLSFFYDNQGYLTEIRHSNQSRILFKRNTEGLVTEVTAPLGKVCKYQYDNAKNLLFSQDIDGASFSYKYDPHHNVIEVAYPDGKRKELLTYNVERDEVRTHQGPGDIITTYLVVEDAVKKQDRLTISVKKEILAPPGTQRPRKLISLDKYSYEFKYRSNGARFLSWLATDVEGIKTETTYNECCGKPLLVKQDGKITKFEYYADGKLKQKVMPEGKMTQLFYDNPFKKVSKVIQNNETSEFQYDERGNLKIAKNVNRKLTVTLHYDIKGRIQSIIDQDARELTFIYNELGKPTKITQKGKGAINVSYDAAGNIIDVQSEAGREIALEVTGVFQNLLEIIRPAGVSLTP